jgi:thioesterase domain-containing protein/acyl carrier protein
VLANGDLEFLGRIDRQVKIRGFRVEPGEIEAALGGHPGVREVAVVAGEDGAGGARLVAYVVPQAGQPPTADELRVALRQRLPDYMTPSVFVPLDALPRTATGKVDRRALPAPELGRPGLSAPFAAPRTPVEAALAASWEAVLGVDPVGVRDNFFDLGGHSLLVAQAMNRLRDAFGLELPLRTLFEAPTVAELAERVEAARRGDAVGAVALAAAPSLVALQPEGAGRPVFLIPGGAGEAFNLFRFAKLARRVGLDRPFYGFYAAADDGEADPKGWVEATAAGYLAEVRAVQPDGPYLLAGACAGAMIAWEMASQLVADGGEVARLLVLDAWVPGARRGVDLQELERRDQRASGRGGGRRGNGDGPGPAATATAAPSLPGGKRNRKGEVNPFKVEAGAVSDRRQRLQQYRPRRYPGRVVLFVNEEWHAEHPTLGWDAVAGGGLEVVVLPGGHGTYLTDHMGAAVERLREFLDGV